MIYRSLLTLLGIGHKHHSAGVRRCRRIEARRNQIRLEWLEDRRLLSTTALTATSPIAGSTPVLIATTTTLTSSPNPTQYGQAVSFTATVAASSSTNAAPSGSVSFLIDSKTFTEPISSGKAVYETTSLVAGSHTIVATYAGSTAYATSTSQIVTQMVNQDATTTSLTDSGSFVVGQPLGLTATVGVVAPGAGTRTGSVTFVAQPVTTTTSTSPPSAITDTVNLSGTSPTVTWSLPSGLPAGAYAITASYSGDPNFLGSTSTALDKTETQIGTTTKLTTSVNPVVTGQPVTLTATVASSSTSLTANLGAAPTGTVTFYDGTTMLGTGPQTLGSGGVAQLTLPAGFAIGGSHSLSAVYSGNSNYSTSTGTLSQSVLVATSMTLGSTPNPSQYGQAVSFTAALTAIGGVPTTNATGGITTTGTVTGSVTFVIDSKTTVTESIVGGKAVYETTSLIAGSHTIVATFAGNSLFAAAPAQTVKQVVNQAATTTSLTYSGSFVVGQSLSLSATVGVVAPGAGTRTGSVTFVAQPVTTTTSTSPPSAITDTVNLSGTSPTVTWSLPSGLPAGAYAITTSYSGDPNFLGSTSTALDKTVTQLGTTTKLTTSVNPVVTGQPVTLTATVASSSISLATTLGAAPTGTVTFYDGTTMLGTGPQTLGSGGVAQLTLPAGFAIGGSHSLKAVYNGDPNYSTSTGTLSQSVLVATSMSLGSTPNPSQYGQAVSFTAVLTALGGIPATSTTGGSTTTGTVTGSVSFLIDSKTTVTESIVGGKAVYETTSLIAGSHTIVATFAGNSLFAAAPAQTVKQVVNQAATTTSLTYSGSFVVGQPLSLSATVGVVAPGAGTRTGSVTFVAQPVTTTTSTSPPSAITDTVNLSGTSPTVTWSLPSGLPAGAYAITASYSGDPNFLGSTSTALDKTVTQLGTTTKLTTSVNPVVTGQPVTLTAAVASSSISLTATLGAAPTGTVTFYDGTTMLGTGPQTLGSGGVAQLILPAGFATGGSQSLRAVYSGNPNYSTSTGTFTETVVSTAAKSSVALTSSANPAVVGLPVTFTVTIATSTSPTIGASGMVTFLDGKTALGMVAVANDQATFTTSTLAAGSHTITAMYSGDANFTSSTSSTLTESVVLPTPGTISGAGTLLSGLDTFNVNVQSTVTAGVPTYSGTLSFTDGKTHDTFNAATITSVQINQVLTPTAGAGTDTYFTITGTATLTTSTPNPAAVTTNGGTYNFVIIGSLPVAGVSTSTGGLEVQITGPNGFTDTLPFTAWDPGETIVVTVTPPSSSNTGT